MATLRLTDVPQDVMEVGVIIAMLPDKENILRIQKERSENLMKLGFKQVISVLSAICKR